MIEHFKTEYEGCIAEVSEFITADGPKEYHLMFHPTVSGSFEDQYSCVKKALSSFITDSSCRLTPIFMRWFLSDASNQQQMLEADDYGCAVSIIEQPPMNGNKLSLWVYLAEGATIRKADDGVWKVDFLGMHHIWTAKEHRHEGNSEKQTWDIFEDYSERLGRRGCTLKDNCIRTWIFVQNIDVNYSGVVKGRREYFTKEDLTPDTHYISSTGIAGRIANPSSSMVMDTYAIEGISPEQICFLKGASHLNPTHEYGVTFERGTAVEFADRKHVFISGTASINNQGEVVHPGDISGQTSRMIENVEVLLNEAGCTTDDIMQMIVYLRDISDYRTVSELIENRFPNKPKTLHWAPVCRPGWLIEMECIAVR